MANRVLTKEEYKKIKTFLKENPGKTQIEVKEKLGFCVTTIRRVKNSKNFDDYCIKYRSHKDAEEKLEEFLKKPAVDVDDKELEDLISDFLDGEKKSKKKVEKINFWSKVKRIISKK